MSTGTALPWLLPQEAAERARVSVRTIYTEAKSGRLRAARVGGRRELRFRPEWVVGNQRGGFVPFQLRQGKTTTRSKHTQEKNIPRHGRTSVSKPGEIPTACVFVQGNVSGFTRILGE
jgi:excisionase family DNA binding protein